MDSKELPLYQFMRMRNKTTLAGKVPTGHVSAANTWALLTGMLFQGLRIFSWDHK